MELGVLDSTIREYFSEVVFCHLISLQMKREGEIPTINGFKAFKVITTEERKYKLVIYLEKWEDLNNLIEKSYDIDGKTLD
ncbi:hypothetical protein RhiirA4_466935 [Rhizophagus irregularis]|uniref:Uncharacterized protein n=1 Tax=Rhizophagus irregularis TaxID=588596 RepID=A0A2I1GUW2_9GLOM|nr:hypothetical protein RhiirA4_466935 [Rhizophagus irregularis]